MTELGDDHRLQEHSERMLAPLIRYDEQHGGDLVRVLRAVVAHPGNRTAAAGASHLSRSVFYQRIALISDLLDADLEDGETLAALHLAVLALPGVAGAAGAAEVIRCPADFAGFIAGLLFNVLHEYDQLAHRLSEAGQG